jgi:hypothetical protein
MTGVGDLIAARYRVVSRVGGGSMGVVWHARDDVLRRDVAVKELLLQPGISDQQADEARRRAMREGRITARLHDPNAITVYDVAEHNGRPCLIMEYLPSTSLADVLAERTTLPVPDVARVGQQVAGALASAHDAGIVHRDVKPGNVLMTEDGTAKLTDFGISRAVGDGTITATGVLAGTPAYLPPEVVEGQDADFRGDVFSLGATLYAAVEGTPPFGLTDNPIAMLHRIATKDIVPPTRAGALTGTLTWMLRKDPAQRPTMRQAQQALAAIADGRTPTEVPPVVPVVVPSEAPTAVATEIVPAEPVAEPAAATAAAAPVAAAPVAGASASRGGRSRRGKVLVAALAVAALVIAGVVVTLLHTGGLRTATASGRTPPSSHPATTTHRVVPPPVTSTTAAAATTEDSHGSKGSPAPTTRPSSPTTTSQLVSTAGGPVGAIVSYYKLVPNDLNDAWNRMTANYQQNHAGGRSGYESFWRPINRVTLADVVTQGADGVVGTISYYYDDGHVDVERTSFGLVQESGIWKIASSSVLSHHTSSG